MFITETTTHNARKQHRCDWCWQFILPLNQYKRYRFYEGGDAGTIKMHPECYKVMQEEASLDGGYIEWTPGMERPMAEYN